jgi:hypothetical protein
LPTRVEYEGPNATIELYVFDDGSCPAKIFLDQLSGPARQKVDALFELMGVKGEIRNTEKFKKLEKSDGLFEFKSFQIRLLCFYDKGVRRKLIITHGVMKKKNKHAETDIRRAKNIRAKYLGDQDGR